MTIAFTAFPLTQPPRAIDTSPQVAGTPVLYAPVTAAATHVVNFTVPTGLSGAKLLIFTTASAPLVSMTFAETLTPAEALEHETASGALFGYIHFLDTLVTGAQELDLVFASACLPVVGMVILSDARGGTPFCVGSDLNDIFFTPAADNSRAVSLIVGSRPTHWFFPYGTESLGSSDAAGVAFGHKGPLNANDQRVSWTPDLPPTETLHLVANVEPVTEAQAAFDQLSLWEMDAADGVLEPDADGNLSSGTWTAPQRGLATIVSGGGGSTGLNGSTSQLAIPHAQAWELDSYTIGGYCQIDSLPVVNTHHNILNKDNGSPAGGISVEARNTAGVMRLRWYNRNAAGTSVFGGGTTEGVVQLTPGVAFVWALVVEPSHPTQPTRMMYRAVGGTGAVVGTSANTVGLRTATGTLFMGRFSNGQSPLPGVLQRAFIGSGVMTLTQFNALANPVSISHVTPVPAPTANNDTFNQAVTQADHDILANDSDVSTGQVTITQQPAAGTASLINNGTLNARLRYVRNPLPVASDVQTIQYIVDGSGEATVTINVQGTGGATPNFITDLNHRDTPNRARPAYNAANPMSTAFVDAPFGTTVVRISGQSGQAIPNGGGLNWPQNVRYNFGNTDDCWNRDGSMLWTGLGGTSNQIPVLYNANDNFRVIRAGVPGTVNRVQTLWDKRPGANTGRMFTFFDSTLREYFPLTGVVNTLATFNNYSNPGFLGQGKCSSQDGRYCAIQYDRNDGQRILTRIDLQNATKGPDVVLPSDQQSGLSISSGGNHLCARLNGGRYFAIYSATTGALVRNLFIATHEAAQMVHIDVFLEGGNDYIIGVQGGSAGGTSRGQMNKVNIVTGAFTHPLSAFDGDSGMDLISCRAIQDNRYAICCYDEAPSGHDLFGEIVAVRLTGASQNVVRRLAWHRSGNPLNYVNQPQPNVSPNGRMIAFHSNWQGTGGTGGDGTTSTYVVVLGPEWSSEPN